MVLGGCGGGSSTSTTSGTTPASNADISGYWDFQSPGAGSMDLTQSGTTVTGTLSFGAPPTISGSVTGNDVKLTFHDEGCVNELSGTLSGDTMSGTVTLTIDSSLGVCSATPGTEPWSAIRTTAPTTTYSTADLNGIWSSHQLIVADAPTFFGWLHSILTFNNGTMSETEKITTSGTLPDSTQTVSLSANGTVSPPGTDVHGVLSTSKDVFVETHTEDGGASSLSIGLKKSGTFSTADLAGTWNFTALKVGDGTNANVWMYGTSVMTATGVSTDTLVADSTGATGGTQTKNFTVASDGTVTSTVAGSDFHANMNSDKNLIAGTVSDGGGSYLLLTWVKAGAAYTQEDLTGTWVVHAIAARDTGNRWGYATLTIDSAGNVPASTWTVSSGSNFVDSTQFVITSSGIVTVPGVSDVYGVLSQDKNTLIIVGNTNSGLDRTLFVAVKR